MTIENPFAPISTPAPAEPTRVPESMLGLREGHLTNLARTVEQGFDPESPASQEFMNSPAFDALV